MCAPAGSYEEKAYGNLPLSGKSYQSWSWTKRNSSSVLDSPRTSGKEVEAMRQEWGYLDNEALERAGYSKRIDPRSLATQGIARVCPRYTLDPSRRQWSGEASRQNAGICAAHRHTAILTAEHHASGLLFFRARRA